MSELSILLTNDDGYDAPGLLALRDALSDLGDVTVVAPATDQSAIGRATSYAVSVEENDNGYVVDGTPSDCVIVGIDALDFDPDVVVAGANKGANVGEHVLGRSGTVSAAVEAAFMNKTAIAVSLYVKSGDVDFADKETEVADYAEAARVTKYLVKHAHGAGVFEHADYLNVNAPAPGTETGEIAVTRPTHIYDMAAVEQDGVIDIHDRMWARMQRGDVPDPAGTDRRAIVEGHTSVSPLTAPHTTEHHDALDALAATYAEFES